MWKLKNGLYSELELVKSGVLNFTSTAVYGDMRNEKTRQRFLKKFFGIKNIISGRQTHSNNIKIISDNSESVAAEPAPYLIRGFNLRYLADGFITNRKNIPLAVFTADCLPVFIFDSVKKIIGLVHAGRVGLEKLIVSKAINIFIKNFGSNPLNIFVAVGPHIKKCCYGVDLEDTLKKQLKKTGVRKISSVSVCTHNNNFFSYRRNRTKKRMISVMVMEG